MRDDELCKAILGVMRCCYVGVKHDTEINLEEWHGTDGEAGVKDYIISLIRAERRKGFMEGYCRGAINAFHELGTEEKIFSIPDNKIGAEREFQKWEAKN